MSKLGVVSDTHGRLIETLAAVRIFREHGVEKIIHCGDIGGVAIIQAFQGFETHLVFGNNDTDLDLLRVAATEYGQTMHDWFGSLEWEGKKICFMHGHRLNQFTTELYSGHWDLMCYGHTHVPTTQMHGNTLLLNPGAFRRVKIPQIAVVTLPELTVENLSVTRIF